eukprot:1338114-Amorphochlora_amoeboformis.AAC.2
MNRINSRNVRTSSTGIGTSPPNLTRLNRSERNILRNGRDQADSMARCAAMRIALWHLPSSFGIATRVTSARGTDPPPSHWTAFANASALSRTFSSISSSSTSKSSGRGRLPIRRQSSVGNTTVMA